VVLPRPLQHLQLLGGPLSNFAFNFNLRR